MEEPGTDLALPIGAKVVQNIVKSNPSAAGKRGAEARERNALLKIGKARDVLARSSPHVAKRAVRAALGQEDVSASDGAMIRDVLDRTVGKAPTLIAVGIADQTLELLRQLQEEEEPA